MLFVHGHVMVSIYHYLDMIVKQVLNLKYE